MYTYTHAHKSSRQPFERDFLQVNVLIPRYSADQSLVRTVNPQHFDNIGRNKINLFMEKVWSLPTKSILNNQNTQAEYSFISSAHEWIGLLGMLMQYFSKFIQIIKYYNSHSS